MDKYYPVVFAVESYMEEFYDPPETIAEQFMAWINTVSSALEIIGLDEEYTTWQNHLKNVRFSQDESSLPIQMAELKALVIGMVGKLERLSSIATDNGGVAFIDPKRIEEIRLLKTNSFDFKKLLELCREINICYATESYFAVAILTRAILDHIPPIFGVNSFNEVVNNYNGGKSFKELMLQLGNQSRKIADLHLHGQIRSDEVLPTRTQVNFQPALDMLLSEIIRISQ